MIIKINCSLIGLHQAHKFGCKCHESVIECKCSPANNWHMSFCFDASDWKQLVALLRCSSSSIHSGRSRLTHSTRYSLFPGARSLAVVNNEMISANCIEIRAKQVATRRAFFAGVLWGASEIGSESWGLSLSARRVISARRQTDWEKCRFVAFKFVHYERTRGCAHLLSGKWGAGLSARGIRCFARVMTVIKVKMTRQTQFLPEWNLTPCSCWLSYDRRLKVHSPFGVIGLAHSV